MTDVGEFEKLPLSHSNGSDVWSWDGSGGCDGLRLTGGVVMSGPGEYPV